MIKAKKYLGQNFLQDKNILQKIINVSDLKKTELILEIGPGFGNLTELLLTKGKQIIAIEKDNDLIIFLKNKFSKEIKNKKLILIHEDILKFNPEKIFNKKTNYKIVANIPYYITGEIFKIIFEKWPTPEKIVLLVQKEVADRITSVDGKESILSISIKKFGEPKKEFLVKAGSFNPSPKVDSAVISVSKIKTNKNTEKFFKIIKTGFSCKRKILVNNLSLIFSKEKILTAFTTCNLNNKIRAERLKVSDWECLEKNLDLY